MNSHLRQLRPELLDTARDHIQGPEEAPIQIVEYGDFQCPYCAQAFFVLREAKHHLGERIRFGYRHFPLPKHSWAVFAAEAAEFAARDGRFWEMHDALFQHQRTLSEEEILRVMDDLDLDSQRFLHEVERGTFWQRIEEDEELAERAGVDGTPVFFINGRRSEEPPTVDEILATAGFPRPSVLDGE